MVQSGFFERLETELRIRNYSQTHLSHIGSAHLAQVVRMRSERWGRSRQKSRRMV